MNRLRFMDEPKARALLQRFGFSNSQIRVPHFHKNLWWTLGERCFGYGDLNSDDVKHIQDSLNDHEVFRGWNEHHGSEWQQLDHPMIIITKKNVFNRKEVLDYIKAERKEG